MHSFVTMNELITAFLIQKGECELAGIGKFSLQRKCAVSDVAEKKILPPEYEVVFSENGHSFSENLYAYIANKKNLSEEEAHDLLNRWSFESKAAVARGESITFPSLGFFSKIDDKPLFSNEHSNLFAPVTAERVIHENDSHKVLVGDKETDSTAMSELLYQEETRERKWWVAALILFIVGLAILLFYYLSNGFGMHLHPEEAPSTYISK